MKKLLSVLLALAALSAALCVTAAAAETAPAAEEPEKLPPFVQVWGKVSPWEGEGIYLKNDDKDSHLNEVVIHPGDAPAVDGGTGLPLDLEKVKEGDTLYVWTGPAMALSLPPQMSALVIVGNVPAGAAAPEFCEIARRAVSPAPGDKGNPTFALTGGETLEVTDKTVYTPWLTRQMVRMEDLNPGDRALVWKDKNGAGYEVRWDKALGVVVSRDGETVFSVQPGAETVQTPEGEGYLSAPCLKEGGTTYLPLEDLCHWLNLYCSWG